MKSIYRTILAVAGSFLAAQFGGWDAALETLVCFINLRLDHRRCSASCCF